MKKVWKILKRILKILGVFVLVIIAALILIPIIFKDKLIKIAKDEINKSLNAKVEFKDIKISAFRSFPNINLNILQLTVVGIDLFEKDTLVSFESFSVDLNLMSIIKGDEIKVRSILLNKPVINAIVLQDGKANWDIVKDTTSTPTDTSKKEESSAFKMSLKKFEIRDAKVKYDDQQSKMFADLNQFNFLLKGDFTDKQTDIDMIMSISELTFEMEGVKYLNKTNLKYVAVLDADMVKSKYTFKKNTLSLNDFEMGFDGWVEMPSSDIFMDIKFASKKADFKSILSLIPAIYMSDFKDLKASGKLAFDGFSKGKLGEKSMPLFGIHLVIENGRFNYPDLPKSVENVNVAVKVNSKDTLMEYMDIDISRFHLEMASNPFDIKALINMFPADMNILADVKGKIDMKSIKDIVPIEGMTLSGWVDADVHMKGKLSAIEKEKYEEFEASGKIGLTDFELITEGVPPMKILSSLLTFTPKICKLESFNSKVGKSDIHLQGQLENYIPYVFSNGTVRGNLDFQSDLFDANEYLTDEETPAPVSPTDTIPVTAFEVPNNINFNLSTKIKKLLYDKIEISQIEGKVTLAESRMSLDKLRMNMLKGSMIMSGYYDSKNIKKPLADFNLEINKFDVQEAMTAFITFRRIAPIVKNAKGNISAQIGATCTLTNELSPVLNTLNAKGRLKSDNLGFSKSKFFDLVGNAIKDDKYKNPTLKNFDIQFSIKDGNLIVDPFTTNISDTKAEISGVQNIDRTMNYVINLSMPKSKMGQQTNQLVDNLMANAKSKGVEIKPSSEIKLALLVTGKVEDPKISIDMKELVADKIEDLKEQAKEEIKKIVDEKKEEVIEDIEKKIQTYMAEAEKKAAELKAAGYRISSQAKAETYKQADNLVSEAKKKNAIAENLAKKTADKLKKEANEKEAAANRETDKKAQEIIDKAKNETEKWKQEAKNKIK